MIDGTVRGPPHVGKRVYRVDSEPLKVSSVDHGPSHSGVTVFAEIERVSTGRLGGLGDDNPMYARPPAGRVGRVRGSPVVLVRYCCDRCCPEKPTKEFVLDLIRGARVVVPETTTRRRDAREMYFATRWIGNSSNASVGSKEYDSDVMRKWARSMSAYAPVRRQDLAHHLALRHIAARQRDIYRRILQHQRAIEDRCTAIKASLTLSTVSTFMGGLIAYPMSNCSPGIPSGEDEEIER